MVVSCEAKQHEDVSQILGAVKAAALPEVQDVLSTHLAKLLRQAETQRQFQARSDFWSEQGKNHWTLHCNQFVVSDVSCILLIVDDRIISLSWCANFI